MAYRFESGETVDDAFHRCVGEQLDRAINELTDGVKADPAAAVHEARKALKQGRSLLRLLRGSLRGAERRRLNDAFREAGQRLSSTRDADVMIEALHDLSEHYAGQLPKRTFDVIDERLSGQRGATRQTLTDSGAIEAVCELLKSVQSTLAETHVRADGWRAIDDGLRRSYGDGRRALRRAQRTPSVENLHEWRKRVKDLWYDLRLLNASTPHIVKGYAKDAHELADVIGDDHDLAVLRESLEHMDDLAVDLDSLLALIDLRREQLQSEAMLLGARIYAEPPKAFGRRLRRYWKAWRAEARAIEHSRPARVARQTRLPAVA